MTGNAVLVLVFCLIGSPHSCHEERPLLLPVPTMQCMVQGQQFAQDWLADHPKWELSRWRCEDESAPKGRQS